MFHPLSIMVASALVNQDRRNLAMDKRKFRAERAEDAIAARI